jgi:hypothetical protein
MYFGSSKMDARSSEVAVRQLARLLYGVEPRIPAAPPFSVSPKRMFLVSVMLVLAFRIIAELIGCVPTIPELIRAL